MRRTLFLRPDEVEPAVLDAIRRDEADLALVHVPVVCGIEAGAAGELEFHEIRRRVAAELVRGLVARAAVMRRLQLAARQVECRQDAADAESDDAAPGNRRSGLGAGTVRPGGRTLTTTFLPRATSSATNTCDMPPPPNSRSRT